MMPTICLDCRYVGSRPSGIGMIVRELVDRLPQLAPDLRFLFLRNGALTGPLSEAPNATEIALRTPTNGPLSMWALPMIVDLNSVDLFHSPSNILPAWLPMPCVTTVHDLMWLNTPELCNPTAWGHVERRFYRHGITRAISSSDAIITVSEATRADLMKVDPMAGERATVILPGVSEIFQPGQPSQDYLKRLGLPSQSPYILTVGQNAPYKNHAGAIRGFAKAFERKPEMQLVMVQRQGRGNEALARLARTLGVSKQVHFIEPVGDAELVDLYRGANALLHPSLVEGFGMPLAEAMACGCPVITSSRSAMPEVAGGAALLVDPENTDEIAAALKRLVSDRGLADALRIKGLQRAQELQWAQFAERHIEVYRRILEGR